MSQTGSQTQITKGYLAHFCMRLTALQCQQAKTKAKPYKLTDGAGLYLEISPKGSKHWRMQYSYHGKRPRISIGPFPLISLADARAERDEMKRLLRQDIDPAEKRRQEKRQRAKQVANTFEVVAREWHQNKSGSWAAGYRRDVLARLSKDVFPTIGASPISDLKAPDILAMVRRCEQRRSFDIARRNLQNVGRVFRYAIATGRCDHDPTFRLWEALEPYTKTHFAAIDVQEIPDFILALRQNNARLFPQTLIAMELMLLTFVRTSELIKATWDEIDLDAARWLIRSERMKMRRDHLVPLSRQACALLKRARDLSGDSNFVFPHAHRSGRHMSNCTVMRGLVRLGYEGRMTGHGFRALAMSAIKEKLGYRHEVIDRQLAHQPRNKVDRAYDRAEFLDERKQMMQDWADYVDRCYQEAVLKRG